MNTTLLQTVSDNWMVVTLVTIIFTVQACVACFTTMRIMRMTKYVHSTNDLTTIGAGIKTLIKIPLCFGLCGTMIGVILGLSSSDLAKLLIDPSHVTNAYQQMRNIILCVELSIMLSLFGLLLYFHGLLHYSVMNQKTLARMHEK